MRTAIWRPGFSGYVPHVGVRTVRADSGWWTGEVVNIGTGKVLHTTRGMRERYAADCAARRYISQNDFPVTV